MMRRLLLLLLIGALLWTLPAQATTLFSQDYEVATINDLPNHTGGAQRIGIYNPTGTSDIVADPLGIHGQVLRQTYNMYECGTPCDGDNSWVSFYFGPAPEIYARYYFMTQPIPANLQITPGPSGYYSITSKQHYLKVDGTSPDGYPNGVLNHLFGSRELAFSLQSTLDQTNGISGSKYPNMASQPLADGQWYCIEYHWKMNTPNVQDGVLEIWVNGTQSLNYTNVAFRDSAHANAAFTKIEVIKQSANNQYRYEDNFVVATTRVGCSGSPSANTTPPPAPTGLSVR
jgi:hypothetical protein